MRNVLEPGSCIGIIGGGQLGRMSAIAAAELGFHCHVLSPNREAPALEVARSATIGAYDARATIESFAQAVDVVTFEFENIPSESLGLLESLRPVRPSRAVLELSQDRIREKTELLSMGLQTAPWVAVTDPTALRELPTRLPYPFIIKQTRFGYDGKGQWRIDDAAALAALPADLPFPLIAEGVVDFACEISVIVARDVYGDVACFDVTENRHHHGILDVSLAPARITPRLSAKADEIARHIAQNVSLVGVMAVELFVDAKGDLLVNEVAPRPHNSGHWTQDACLISQFTAHVQMVAGYPVRSLSRHSDAVMKNLIGPSGIALAKEAASTEGTRLHLYGKATAQVGRKMGHVNALFPKDALPNDLGLADSLGPLFTHRLK